MKESLMCIIYQVERREREDVRFLKRFPRHIKCLTNPESNRRYVRASSLKDTLIIFALVAENLFEMQISTGGEIESNKKQQQKRRRA